jgi:H+-transporting ATPase
LVFNALLAAFHEVRSEKALASLKSRLAPVATVRRDGEWRSIASAEVVPDDLVQVGLGMIVPADAKLVSGNVLADQSALTGESIAVSRSAGGLLFAGTMIRGGAADAVVTATGRATYFGRTAELVQIARAPSSEQSAVMSVVKTLAVINGGVIVVLVAYAHTRSMPIGTLLPLVLSALLAVIPVALPATFGLAAALSAQALALRGVLATRLSAIHDASGIDVLCSDKTGTLTENRLTVTAIEPFAGFEREAVLEIALAASTTPPTDPVDSAIHLAAPGAARFEITDYKPFDPQVRYARAEFIDDRGRLTVAIKGAPRAVAAIARTTEAFDERLGKLANGGARVLAIATGPEGALDTMGLIGLSDPPREDAKQLVDDLAALGVSTIMVTGDMAQTAVAVARKVGIADSTGSRTDIDAAGSKAFGIYASVLPEDKFRLVKALQASGHSVAMCGDGANDAPALRQAQLGVAVSTATDVAKSAAAFVLVEPGLNGVLEAVKEGRRAFQRVLSYTLNSLIRKVELVLFLVIGQIAFGVAPLTPLAMALLLVMNDVVAMALVSETAEPAVRPCRWRMRAIVATSLVVGVLKLTLSLFVMWTGIVFFGVQNTAIVSLAFAIQVFGAQALMFALRDRRAIWSSVPGRWIWLSGVANTLLCVLVVNMGVLARPIGTAEIVMTGLAAAGLFVVFEVTKPFLYRAAGLV